MPSSKPPLTIITVAIDTAQGDRTAPLRRHEMKLPNPAMRDCVDCTLPFYSRSAANVVCLPCREASTATFEGGPDASC